MTPWQLYVVGAYGLFMFFIGVYVGYRAGKK